MFKMSDNFAFSLKVCSEFRTRTKMVSIEEIVDEAPKIEPKLTKLPPKVEKGKKREKFTLLLDNVDPNENKRKEEQEEYTTKDEAQRAKQLLAELNDDEKAKNYPR